MSDRNVRPRVERQVLYVLDGSAPFSAHAWRDLPLLGCDVLELRGEVCTASVARAGPVLRTWLETKENSSTQIDTAAVDFIDGRGISLLLELHRRGNRPGNWFWLGRTSPCVSRLLKICGAGTLDVPTPAPTRSSAGDRRCPTGVRPR